MNKKLPLFLTRFLCIALPIFAVFLIADLVSKALIDSALTLGESASFLPGFIDIVTVHNQGSAWGLFEGMDALVIIITFIFVIGLAWYTFAEKISHPLYHVAFGFMLAGCIGNLVDRIAFGYVRDFLHFEFWPSFPVFNIADICLTIGVVLFVIFVIIISVKHYKNKKNEGKIEQKDQN